MFRIQLQGDWKQNKVYSGISHDLVEVLNDRSLRDAAQRMEEKVAVFNRLRKAMRITLPENKRGLNDRGALPASMTTIEKEVGKFRTRLVPSKECSERAALAMNLNNKEYMNLLLSGNTTLDERFAEIDSRKIRNQLLETVITPQTACPRMRKIIRLPNLPESIVALLECAAS